MVMCSPVWSCVLSYTLIWIVEDSNSISVSSFAQPGTYLCLIMCLAIFSTIKKYTRVLEKCFGRYQKGNLSEFGQWPAEMSGAKQIHARRDPSGYIWKILGDWSDWRTSVKFLWRKLHLIKEDSDVRGSFHVFFNYCSSFGFDLFSFMMRN